MTEVGFASKKSKDKHRDRVIVVRLVLLLRPPTPMISLEALRPSDSRST